LSSVDCWTQVYWVWHFARPMFPWVQITVEPKYVGSGISSDPCYLGFNGRLNLRMLGLTFQQTHVFLGSGDGWTQVYWIWHITNPKIHWVRLIAESKCFWFGITSDPCSSRFNRLLNPNILSLDVTSSNYKVMKS
jgi:hypothetical protein